MPPPPTLTDQYAEHTQGIEAAWASGWTASTARSAVDEHKRGRFISSWQLSIDAPSYPPIRAALRQVVSAARAADYTIDGPKRAPGRVEVEAARDLWRDHLAPIQKNTYRDLAMMGLSVWQHPIEVNPDTLRHEVKSVERWPIAAVEYLPFPPDGGPEGYFAVTADGARIRLPKPGTTDGLFTVIGEGDQPHLDGAITALDMSFIAGQRGRRAFANLTDTMGKASVIGEMPPEIATTTPEGVAMLNMVRALGTSQTAGVHPHGGKVYPFEVTTQTGQLLPQLTDQEARMVAWALLGHDATISRGDVYNDPTAQAVPEDLTRENVRVFCSGVNALLALLAALNAGDVDPPVLSGVLPDSDQDARLKAEDGRRAAQDEHDAAVLERTKLLLEQLGAARTAGIVLTQAYVDELAAAARVPAPRLPVVQAQPPAA